ncbi:hypothetical protein DMENIID0001_170090 [Sergentomyia squamirostris]
MEHQKERDTKLGSEQEEDIILFFFYHNFHFTECVSKSEMKVVHIGKSKERWIVRGGIVEKRSKIEREDFDMLNVQELDSFDPVGFSVSSKRLAVKEV